jgi:hypothetical protein
MMQRNRYLIKFVWVVLANIWSSSFKCRVENKEKENKERELTCFNVGLVFCFVVVVCCLLLLKEALQGITNRCWTKYLLLL